MKNAVVYALTILASVVLGYSATRYRGSTTEGTEPPLPTQPVPDVLARTVSAPALLEELSEAKLSPLEINDCILLKLEDASSRDIGRLAALLKQPRYALDPGMKLITRIVDMQVHLRHPEVELRRQIPEGHWNQLLGQWAARDVEAAFHCAMTLQPEHLRAEFLKAVFKGAYGPDPHKVFDNSKVMELLETIKDDELRHYLADDAINVTESPERFADVAKAYPAQWRDIYEQAFRAMATADPQQAITALGDVPNSRRKVAIEALLDGWAMNGDPVSAAEWALQNNSRLGRSALTAWAVKEPISALDHAFANYAGEPRIEMMGNMIYAALDSSPEQVMQWIDSTLTETEGGKLLADYSLNNTRSDPPQWQIEAATRAASVPSEGTGNLRQFVSNWQDKVARHAWVMSLPPMAQRNLVPEVLADWFLTNPAEAGTYVDAIPNSTARATVFNEMFRNTYDASATDTAARWAKSHLDSQTQALVPKLSEIKKGGTQ
ncbi:MAG: hypothetical protein ACI9R3_003963 [Verrucomicrobiales bacterium]|jgi:hypothetical protein